MLSPEDYATIIKGICSKLNIVPDDTLMINVTQFCRKKNLSRLEEQYETKSQLSQFLIDSYLKHLIKEDPISDIRKVDYPKKSEALVGPISQWSSHSMHVDIDSINRDISRDNGSYITDFRFTLSDRNDRSPLGTGMIPARIIPANISYMKIGRIILPYSNNLNISQELTLTFTGIRNNGAITANLLTNETIHFSFTYLVCAFNSNLIELKPVNKYCKFDPPLTYLDDLSIRFNEPRYVAQFYKDRMKPLSIAYNFNPIRITFTEDHHLNNNDVIIINGLTTLNDNANSEILRMVNNPKGLKISVITSTTIELSIDISAIQDTDANSLPVIIFVSKTFRVPLEIGYEDSADRI